MIIKTLKENSLQIQEFFRFAKLSKIQFNYAIKKNDPIYIKGLESKLYKFIEWKIKQLRKVINAI